MSRKRRTLVIPAVALSVLGATAIAWGVDERPPNPAAAQGADNSSPRWGSHRHGGPMAHLGRHLDLSDEQRTQIKAILSRSRAESVALRAQMQAMRSELRAMIRDNGYYEDQARMLVESNTPAFVDLTVLGIRTMSEIYAVLTPEQKARADEMLAGRKGRFGGRGLGFMGD